MWALFLRSLKDRRISLLIYSISGMLFLWMYVAMFPSISEQAASYNDILKTMPESLLKAFGISDFSLSSIENFVGVEHFSIVWPLIVIAFAISIASFSIAREIEQGSIEFVLSRPVSRLKIFFGRYLAGVMMITVFTIVSILSIIPLAHLHGVSYQLSHFVTIGILGLLFGLAVLSIAFMLSAFFSEKSKVSMASGGILVLMYVFNLVSALKENLANLKYASFFYYFDYADALIRNIISHQSIWVFVIVSLVCTLVGAWWFTKRDVAV